MLSKTEIKVIKDALRYDLESGIPCCCDDDFGCCTSNAQWDRIKRNIKDLINHIKEIENARGNL